MTAILTQLVYLKYRAGRPPVAASFEPRYRVSVNTAATLRARGNLATTMRTRTNANSTMRGRGDL